MIRPVIIATAVPIIELVTPICSLNSKKTAESITERTAYCFVSETVWSTNI